MRVVAGSRGGRRLLAPPGDATRPTSDRVREALFSILAARVPGADVLDLFAGSGALGIEALSRGAARATFVDAAPAAARAVRANLAALDLAGLVVRAGARAALADPRVGRAHYDLVFLDPPYGLAERLGWLEPALRDRLAPGGRVVCESDRRAPIPLDMPLHDERRYGDTLVRIHGSGPR